MASSPRPLRLAIALSLASVVWSGLVGGAAVGVALATHGLSLLGFGADSAVDALASLTLIWRFAAETRQPHRAERVEAVAERVLGAVLVTIAIYLVVGAVGGLLAPSHPEPSLPALFLLVASVIVLPPLAVAKRAAAARLRSRALRADSVLTFVGAALAAIGLVSTALAGALGVTWADPIGALVIAAVVAREGWASVRAGLPSAA